MSIELTKSDLNLVNEVRVKYDIVIMDYNPTRLELKMDDGRRRNYISDILGQKNQINYNLILSDLTFRCDANFLYSPGMMVAETIDLIPFTNFNANKKTNRKINSSLAFLGETIGYNLSDYLINLGFLPVGFNAFLGEEDNLFTPPDWYYVIPDDASQLNFCFSEAKATYSGSNSNENFDYSYNSGNPQSDFIKYNLRTKVKEGLSSAMGGLAISGLPLDEPNTQDSFIFIAYVTVIDNYDDWFNGDTDENGLRYIELGRTLVAICKPPNLPIGNFTIDGMMIE